MCWSQKTCANILCLCPSNPSTHFHSFPRECITVNPIIPVYEYRKHSISQPFPVVAIERKKSIAVQSFTIIPVARKLIMEQNIAMQHNSCLYNWSIKNPKRRNLNHSCSNAVQARLTWRLIAQTRISAEIACFRWRTDLLQYM